MMEQLWIDFKLYFYVRIHKLIQFLELRGRVVNWFQIVFLREDSQDSVCNFWFASSCELISNCIFTWGFTSLKNLTMPQIGLWIDFKLYFYVRIHKGRVHYKNTVKVVNWFQIVFLREDSQVELFYYRYLQGCELISNCIFTWGFTRIMLFLFHIN